MKPHITAYKKEKIKILKQLGVVLTKDDLDYLDDLTTETEVDRFARDLIIKPDRPEPKKTVKPPVKEEIDITTKEMYTTGELARILGVSYRSIYRWIENGELVFRDVRKVQGRKDASCIHITDLLDFIMDHPKHAKKCNQDVINKLISAEVSIHERRREGC